MNKKELLETGYKEYRGREINVYFNLDLCIHSGICINGDKKVFNPKRRPWILCDLASKQDIIEIIDCCPSGALQYDQDDKN